MAPGSADTTLQHHSGPPAPLSAEKQDFLDRFISFWSAPSGARVPELIAPDAQVHFPGAGTISGADYVGVMGAALEGVPDIKVETIDYAERGDTLFIFWHASGLVVGQKAHWHGVDRFRLRDGMAVEEHVVFDPTVLRGG